MPPGEPSRNAPPARRPARRSSTRRSPCSASAASKRQPSATLLRALFRYGGDPGHPLSWFGPASRAQRDASIAVFEAAIAGDRLPDDVRAAAPVLLWTLHMGVLLYFLYDESANAQRTRRLVDAAVDFVIDAKRVASLPLMRPVRRRVLTILQDAGLMAA